jgi:predicted nucleic acid-binding protein
MNAVDTNVIFYTMDPQQPAKAAVALQLLATLENWFVPWQVYCELTNGIRKLEKLGADRDGCRKVLTNLRQKSRIFMPTEGTVERAWHLQERYSLSFWDANLVAACLEQKMSFLYSEDITGYPHIDGLELHNPFVVKG